MGLKDISTAIENFGKIMFEGGKEDATATILKQTFREPEMVEAMVEPSLKPSQPIKEKWYGLEDEVFEEPSFLAAMEELERTYQINTKIKNAEGLTPSFDLGVSSPSDNEAAKNEEAQEEVGTPIPEKYFYE